MVKSYIRDLGTRLKGNGVQGDNVPRAALGDLIPCKQGTPGRPAIPVPYVRPQGAPITPISRDITLGTQVVLTPLVRSALVI